MLKADKMSVRRGQCPEAFADGLAASLRLLATAVSG
jgi:hypothetical protein